MQTYCKVADDCDSVATEVVSRSKVSTMQTSTRGPRSIVLNAIHVDRAGGLRLLLHSLLLPLSHLQPWVTLIIPIGVTP